jgi:hypothetical protein
LINVRGDKCTIQAQENQYFLPEEGWTIPIIFDFYNCFPVNDIIMTATSDNVNVVFDEDMTFSTLNSETSIDSRLIFTAHHV